MNVRTPAETGNDREPGLVRLARWPLRFAWLVYIAFVLFLAWLAWRDWV